MLRGSFSKQTWSSLPGKRSRWKCADVILAKLNQQLRNRFKAVMEELFWPLPCSYLSELPPKFTPVMALGGMNRRYFAAAFSLYKLCWSNSWWNILLLKIVPLNKVTWMCTYIYIYFFFFSSVWIVFLPRDIKSISSSVHDAAFQSRIQQTSPSQAFVFLFFIPIQL